MATRPARLSPSPVGLFNVFRQSIKVSAFVAPTARVARRAQRLIKGESGIVRNAVYLHSPRPVKT